MKRQIVYVMYDNDKKFQTTSMSTRFDKSIYNRKTDMAVVEPSFPNDNKKNNSRID